MDMSKEKLICVMLDAGISAARKISEIYHGEYEIEYKSDASPVTSADLASESVILPMLRRNFPDCSVLSEESADEDSSIRLTNECGVFIVDPLDGTADFVQRDGEFAVSIGFSQAHRVIAGVIAVPEQKVAYYALKGEGAYKIGFEEYDGGFAFGDGKRLHVSDRACGLHVAVSRTHVAVESDDLLERNRDRIAEVVKIGSCYKGCRIAEGILDVHYRYGDKTKEWDTAAMQVIVTEAGGIFTDLDGREIIANRADYVNRCGFIILNRAESALK